MKTRAADSAPEGPASPPKRARKSEDESGDATTEEPPLTDRSNATTKREKKKTSRRKKDEDAASDAGAAAESAVPSDGLWLVKSEPDEYGLRDLEREERGAACWDGVRNAEARKHLAGMKAGDKVLFYHSGKAPAVVGTAEVARESYPDPTSDNPGAKKPWLAVDLRFGRWFRRPVTLTELKTLVWTAGPKLGKVDVTALSGMALLTRPRLSVQPVSATAWESLLALAEMDPFVPADSRPDTGSK